MSRQSKYIISRMSLHLENTVGLNETTFVRLLYLLTSPEIVIIEPKIVYFNKDKSKGLVYSHGEFSIVTQNKIVPKGGTIYDRKTLTSKEGFELLNITIRGEKLKKIKKKINGTTK